MAHYCEDLTRITEVAQNKLRLLADRPPADNVQESILTPNILRVTCLSTSDLNRLSLCFEVPQLETTNPPTLSLSKANSSESRFESGENTISGPRITAKHQHGDR